MGEFIEQVVGEEVVLAGNSIGGYTAAQVASDRPLLVSHLVLLNSAGRMRVEEAPPPPYEVREGVTGAGWGLFGSLISEIRVKCRG